MVMDTLQIRLGRALIERIDDAVKMGVYGSRSDAIREAVRHFFWHNQVGTMKPKGEAVQLVRKAREELSKKRIDLDEINRF